MIPELVLQTIFLTIAFGTVSHAIAERLNFPGIVLYLLIGIILGPHILGLIAPQETLGAGLNVIIMVFVSIILFEGGLSLDIRALQRLQKSINRQILFGILITMLVAWAACYFILGMSWELALIFGSLAVVTGPTVIAPIIRRIPLNAKVKCLLNGEAILIDAVGAILAIVVLGFVIEGEVFRIGHSALEFGLSILVGVAVGVVFGFGTKFLFSMENLLDVPTRSIFVLGLVFAAFFLAEWINPESGIMAVAVFGLVLSTLPHRVKEQLLHFKDQLSRITISILFILLAATFEISLLKTMWVQGLLIVGLIMLARFLVVFISTSRRDFSVKEQFFMGWVGPRGIIAISMASIAGIRLHEHQFDQAGQIEILMFMLIGITVLGQGLSARWLAHKLKILVSGDGDLVILGVNKLTLAIARVWRELKYEVLLIDSMEENCKLAEKEGFHVLHGNALDPMLFEGLELTYYNTVLAASKNDEINALFCRFCREHFGIKNVFAAFTERANQELASIIETEHINFAFGKPSESKNPRQGFLTDLLRLFSTRKQVIEHFQVKHESWIDKSLGQLPLPEKALILCLVRDGKTTYVYHNELKLRLNDEIYVSMDESEASNLSESLLYGKPSDPSKK